MDTLALDAIVIGDRVRKDMGDLAGLAESMQRHGLLHPVVVTKDALLVAGHRRIEAARLLGWTEVPVTVVSVEDLLSAERDENEVRKDFTPTEAVAIGRLIEEREHPKAKARRVQKMLTTTKLRLAGEMPEDVESTSSGRDRTATARAIAARAVGLGEATYHYAKKVVAAAEAEPDRFGDLPAKMDDTGSVAGTYRELQRRRGEMAPDSTHAKRTKAPKPSSSERLPINYKRHHVNPNEVVRKAVDALDGLCAGLRIIDPAQVDAPDALRWAEQFAEYAREIRAFGRRLSHGEK